MSNLVRLSLSIEKPLLDRLEKMVQGGGYTNRSEFVRDMIRDLLVRQEWKRGEEVVGTINLIYNHHVRQLSEKLTHTQHHHHKSIMATTHIHLDEELCAETIMVRGKASEIKELADDLRKQKGVLHANLSASSTGKLLK